MEKVRSALRFGVPLQFRDRWDGRLQACEVDADWAVRNLVIGRGLIFRQSVRLPFSAVSEWSDGAIALDCTADEAFGRQITPEGVPSRRLDAGTTVVGSVSRLVGLMVDRRSRQATHLLLEHGRVVPEGHLVSIEEAGVEGGRIVLRRQADAYPVYRTDDDLVYAVRSAIIAHRYLSEDDRRGLVVEASDGVLYLRGNVRTAAARRWVQESAQQVDDVREVRNEVVDDPSLEIAVAKALADAGLFQRARVFVRAVRGNIVLTGYVPSQAVQRDVERVAAGVAAVRGVTAKLQLQPVEESKGPSG